MRGEQLHLKGKRAEEAVHALARRSFLADWCYLNPRLPDGRELCDLLVVFDDIATIWQIKDLKLDAEGRYKTSEVEKNLRQLSGARRQLVDLGRRIDLENPRRGRERFYPPITKQIYLISVFFGDPEEPFSFVEAVKNHTVHVFTRLFTEIILHELDTIADFVDYLREKEWLVARDKTITILGGEEELLAFYLLNNRSFKRLDKPDHILITEGSWKLLSSKPEYLAKKRADEISYYWDSIIDRAHEAGGKYEVVARELARANRVQRRFLSKVMFEAHVQAHHDDTHDMFRRMVVTGGISYCFLFQDDPEPHERRRAMLGAMCLVARGLNQQSRMVLGIATEKIIRPECSYDFSLLEIPEWTEEHQKEMERVQKEIGIFVRPEVCHMKEREYPVADADK